MAWKLFKGGLIGWLVWGCGLIPGAFILWLCRAVAVLSMQEFSSGCPASLSSQGDTAVTSQSPWALLQASSRRDFSVSSRAAISWCSFLHGCTVWLQCTFCRRFQETRTSQSLLQPWAELLSLVPAQALLSCSTSSFSCSSSHKQSSPTSLKVILHHSCNLI